MHCDVGLRRQRLCHRGELRGDRRLGAAVGMSSLPLAFATISTPPAIPPPASAFALALVRRDGLALRDRGEGRIRRAGLLRRP
jgi:hypothetical protein